MRCAPLPEFLREGAHPVGLAPERPIFPNISNMCLQPYFPAWDMMTDILVLG